MTSLQRSLAVISLIAMIAGGVWMAQAEEGKSPANCDRACLDGLIDRYLAALVAHDPMRVPSAESVKFTENTAALKLGEGAWKTATGVGSYQIHIADPVTNQAAFIGVLKEGGKATMFALRLKAANRRITEIETILARSGLGGVSDLAPSKLVTSRAAFAQVLAKPERSAREKMMAVANSYYEGIERGSGDVVPFAADCHRIENGVALVNNPGFEFPLRSPSGRKLPNFAAMGCREQFNTRLWTTDNITSRRFPVIDEERGVAAAFTIYNSHGTKECADVVGIGPVCPAAAGSKPGSLDLLEFFKIRNGEIHEMESVWTILPYRTKSGW